MYKKVGDSRVVMGGNKIDRLSYDHKGLDIPEINRVQRTFCFYKIRNCHIKKPFLILFFNLIQ